MSADFWAGYISGAVGIVIGNPLDVLKVKLQAGLSSTTLSSPPPSSLPQATPPPNAGTAAASARSYIRPFLTGTAAPVLGYGALNALLFVSYNRTEAVLNSIFLLPAATGSHLGTTWLAGAAGGLATWVVSTPTELVKCRAQLSSSPAPAPSRQTACNNSSWAITRRVLRTEGIRGLYLGGAVTAIRDSVGYGFYFWSYELAGRRMDSYLSSSTSSSSPSRTETGSGSGSGSGSASGTGSADASVAKILLCGGLAGIVTWASIFPLDVIKTRVQTQGILCLNRTLTYAERGSEREAFLPPGETSTRRHGAREVALETYREGGLRPFFRGLTVCSVRAFVVNAVQWAVYEWIMTELGQGRQSGSGSAAREGEPRGEMAGLGQTNMDRRI